MRSKQLIILFLLTQKARIIFTLLLLLSIISSYSHAKLTKKYHPQIYSQIQFNTITYYSDSSQFHLQIATKMGGGSVLRPALRPVVRAAGLKPRRMHPCPDSSSSSALPSASASVVAGVRTQSAAAAESVRQVFGPVPSEPEAEEALSALIQVFTQMSHTGTARDIQPSSIDQSNSQGTAPTTGITGDLHAGNGTTSNGFTLSASTSRGLDTVRKSLDLLNWNPSFQKVVLSLSTDEAVWEAIMRNEAVQELHKCLIQAGRNEPLAFVGQDDFVPRILMWIIDISKTKILELINQISDMIGVLFRSRGADETTEILNDVIKSAFMLTVMILIVIVVSRVQAESNR